MLLNYKPCKNIKEAAVPNVPSCKISSWKNVREKGEKQFRTKFTAFSVGQDGWKTFFMKIS